ncbi:hypothetical protein GQ42DRAFT_163178 [Ramicandelaber brevisporus]|nr:hypothetical protein GQ42DRAFT_163178 [Ramicandelaber brevisporus]
MDSRSSSSWTLYREAYVDLNTVFPIEPPSVYAVDLSRPSSSSVAAARDSTVSALQLVPADSELYASVCTSVYARAPPAVEQTGIVELKHDPAYSIYWRMIAMSTQEQQSSNVSAVLELRQVCLSSQQKHQEQRQRGYNRGLVASQTVWGEDKDEHSLATPVLFVFTASNFTHSGRGSPFVKPGVQFTEDSTLRTCEIAVLLGTGAICRISLPFATLHHHSPSQSNASSIQSMTASVSFLDNLTMSHGESAVALTAVDGDMVAVARDDAAIVLVDRRRSGSNSQTKQTETLIAPPTKGLAWLASAIGLRVASGFSPSKASNPSAAADGSSGNEQLRRSLPISVQSLRAPGTSDVAFIAMLCRDRTLRMFSVMHQRHALEVALPVLSSSSSSSSSSLGWTVFSPQSTVSQHQSSQQPLLPASYHPYIVPLQHHNPSSDIYFLVYVPDVRAPYFAVMCANYDPSSRMLIDVVTVATRSTSDIPGIVPGRDSLVSFAVSSNRLRSHVIDERVDEVDTVTIWTLWDSSEASGSGSGESHITATVELHLERLHQSAASNNRSKAALGCGNRWFTVAQSSTSHPTAATVSDPALFAEAALGPATFRHQLDALLQNPTTIDASDVVATCVDYILQPGLFSHVIISHAIVSYVQATQGSTEGFHSVETLIGASMADVVGVLCSTIGASSDDQEPASMDETITEWLRFITICERIARRMQGTPRTLVITQDSTPILMLGSSNLAFVVQADPAEVVHLSASRYPAASSSSLLGAIFTGLRPSAISSIEDENADSDDSSDGFHLLSDAATRRAMSRTVQIAHMLRAVLSHSRVYALVHELIGILSAPQIDATESLMTALYNRYFTPTIADDALLARLANAVVSANASIRQSTGGRETLLDALAVILRLIALPTAHLVGVASTGAQTSLLADGILAAIIQQSVSARYELAVNVLVILVFLIGGSLARPDSTVFDSLASAGVLNSNSLPDTTTDAMLTVHAYHALLWVSTRAIYDEAILVDASASASLGGVNHLPLKQDKSTKTAQRALRYSLLHSILRRVIHSSWHPEKSTSALALNAIGCIAPAISVGNGVSQQAMQFNPTLLARSIEQLASSVIAQEFTLLFTPIPATIFLRGLINIRSIAEDADAADAAFDAFSTASMGYSLHASHPERRMMDFVLPNSIIAAPSASIADYWQYVALVFASVGRHDFATKCYRMALTLSGSDNEENTLSEPARRRIWLQIFHSLMDSKLFEEAHMAMLNISDSDTQLQCLRHLATSLCETPGLIYSSSDSDDGDMDDESSGRTGIQILCNLAFIGLQEQLIEVLGFKARNSDIINVVLSQNSQQPHLHVNYYKVLYTYQIFRSDYLNAAATMYRYALRLGEVLSRSSLPPISGIDASALTMVMARERASALLMCINALELQEGDVDWIHVSIGEIFAQNTSNVNGKRSAEEFLTAAVKKRRLALLDCSSEVGVSDVELSAMSSVNAKTGLGEVIVVQLADVRADYSIALAHLQLAEYYDHLTMPGTAASTMDAPETVALFIKAGLFDQALSIAKMFDIDGSGVLVALADLCIQFDNAANDEAIASTILPPAFLTGNVMMRQLDGTISERAWQLLHRYIDLLEEATAVSDSGAATRCRLRVAEHILSSRSDSPVSAKKTPLLPAWIYDPLAANASADLMDLLSRHGHFYAAADLAEQIIEKQSAVESVIATVTTRQLTTTSLTRFLPYETMDLLIQKLDDMGEYECTSRLKRKLEIYFKRVDYETLHLAGQSSH